MKSRKAVCVIITLLMGGIFALHMNSDIGTVRAEQAQYTYDSLGRVKTVTYQDGTKMTYVYDNNGNINAIKKENLMTETDTSEQTTTEKVATEKSETLALIAELDRIDNPNIEKLDYLAEKSLNVEIQGYNQFKKKKPVIRSLKTVTKNGKLYLKIKIKRLQLKSGYKEQGYEIKYATNKKFKSAKTEKVTRNQKKNLTTKTWKVKKNKTYYVKVRAYMKTKKGKKIYSKYSVVKSITVNP